MNRPSDGSAPVLLALWRAVRTLRPMPKEELLTLCVPEFLQETEGRARKTLNRWTQIGLFAAEENVIRLAAPFDKLALDTDVECWAFRHAVRRLALRPEANADFMQIEPSGTADFTFACAWLLSSDVYGSQFCSLNSIEAHEEATIERAGGAKFVIQNSVRWDGFRDWATFLGFGWNSSPFQLDPTEAIEFELRSFLESNGAMTINEVVRHVGKHIPVLDGGEYAVRARERATKGWRPIADHEISPAFSRALLRMEKAGQIAFSVRSDADYRTLLGRDFRGFRQVTHIEAMRSL